MPTRTEQAITGISSFIAIMTGSASLALQNISLILSSILSLISIIAGILIICVNWKKGINQIKEWIR